MFRSESQLQALVHDNPDIILSGIPEVDPNLCPDTPAIVSLGREIRLDSGPIDNLFIDTNAVLTFVECKRYSDGRIKREVHAQAVNYAADLQGMLTHYNGSDFLARFIEIIQFADDTDYRSIDQILDDLAKDPVLENRNIADWKRQFLERLELNIKNGVCRIVIVCAPDPRSNFSYTQIRNLMKLMQFTESSQSNYDLILMDLREAHDAHEAKIIWRRYAALPLIPLLANSSRDTSRKIEALHDAIENLDGNIKTQLDNFIACLDELGIYTKDKVSGFSLYSQETHKSLYVQIQISNSDWQVNRHQIRRGEEIFDYFKGNNMPDEIRKFNPSVSESSGVAGAILDVVIPRTDDMNPEELAQLIAGTLGVKQ